MIKVVLCLITALLIGTIVSFVLRFYSRTIAVEITDKTLLGPLIFALYKYPIVYIHT